MIFTKKQASRKFIDLVNTASSKWANWDPAIPIKPGDYGAIDKHTGQFEREGNIFRVPDIAHITSKHVVIPSPNVESFFIQSHNAKSLKAETYVRLNAQGSALSEGAKTAPGASADGNGLAKILCGGQWKFSYTRGALLLLYKSQIMRLSDELLEELKETEWGHGKHIVTHTYTCPAYALYLSNKDSETVSVGLHANTALGMVGITAGASAGLAWLADGASGIFQQACQEDHVFVPLYQIKEIKKRKGRRRESPDPDNDEKEDWVPIEAPWNYLDEDGNELADQSDED